MPPANATQSRRCRNPVEHITTILIVPFSPAFSLLSAPALQDAVHESFTVARYLVAGKACCGKLWRGRIDTWSLLPNYLAIPDYSAEPAHLLGGNAIGTTVRHAVRSSAF